MLNVLICYFVLLNFISFLFMASDKRRAKKGTWRIAEKTLLGLAVFGGSIGIYIGMHLLRHKTRKPLFRFGVPIILLLQILLAAAVVFLNSHGIASFQPL